MISFLKNYFPIILAVLAIVGIGFGIYKISEIDTKPVLATVFTRGNIDEETGVRTKDEKTLVTKELVECKGLEIEPNFDTKLVYRIFWFNQDKIYFGCTDEFNQNTKFLKTQVPDTAAFCHIVIIPELYDKDGNLDPEAKIPFYETLKYAIKLSIKVKIKQNHLGDNLFLLAKAKPFNAGEEKKLSSLKQFSNDTYYLGFDGDFKSYQLRSFDVENFSENTRYSIMKINCSGILSYKMKYEGTPHAHTYFYFYDKDGNAVNYSQYGDVTNVLYASNSSYEIEIVVPERAEYMIISLPKTTDNHKMPNVSLREYLPSTDLAKKHYMK